jgi:hypothetical protein
MMRRYFRRLLAAAGAGILITGLAGAGLAGTALAAPVPRVNQGDGITASAGSGTSYGQKMTADVIYTLTGFERAADPAKQMRGSG